MAEPAHLFRTGRYLACVLLCHAATQKSAARPALPARPRPSMDDTSLTLQRHSAALSTSTPRTPRPAGHRPSSAKDAPNVVLIITDDVGFGAPSTLRRPYPRPPWIASRQPDYASRNSIRRHCVLTDTRAALFVKCRFCPIIGRDGAGRKRLDQRPGRSSLALIGTIAGGIRPLPGRKGRSSSRSRSWPSPSRIPWPACSSCAQHRRPGPALASALLRRRAGGPNLTAVGAPCSSRSSPPPGSGLVGRRSTRGARPVLGTRSGPTRLWSALFPDRVLGRHRHRLDPRQPPAQGPGERESWCRSRRWAHGDLHDRSPLRQHALRQAERPALDGRRLSGAAVEQHRADRPGAGSRRAAACSSPQNFAILQARRARGKATRSRVIAASSIETACSLLAVDLPAGRAAAAFAARYRRCSWCSPSPAQQRALPLRAHRHGELVEDALLRRSSRYRLSRSGAASGTSQRRRARGHRHQSMSFTPDAVQVLSVLAGKPIFAISTSYRCFGAVK